MSDTTSITIAIAVIAALYSSVGHAGASGYIAVLTLAGWSASAIRPLALILNLLVALIASAKFYRAGYFRPHLFISFALPAIPLAFLGGYIELPRQYLSRLLGIVLLGSVAWMLIRKREPQSPLPPKPQTAILVGASIGFLAGLSGTGGGIFLSPTMLFLSWARLKEISATAAPFILLNSAAGLLGLGLSGIKFSSNWLWFLGAAGMGGLLGATVGSKIVNVRLIQYLLATVLTIAGVKLLLA